MTDVIQPVQTGTEAAKRSLWRSTGARLGDWRRSGRHWTPAHTWRLVGVIVFAAAASHLVTYYLLTYPGEIWQVDLDVYREAARGLLQGHEVYSWLTPGPQWLPFTYPPFSALLGIPLAMIPFRVAGYAWSVVQLALLWLTVGIAFRPFLRRFGVYAGLFQGLIAGILTGVDPISQGIRFGQVNAVLVWLCLVDLTRRADGRWPRGTLTGIAAAIKLTPAVFWVHWAVSRRWRPLIASLTAAALCTLVTVLVAPAASLSFWTDALLDPNRLGPNAGAANQSLRGMLLRALPTPGLVSAAWLVLALAVGVAGFALSARLERLGEPVAVVGAVGMIAVLVSPVSWDHHLHWGLVVIGALLGDGRSVGRLIAAVLGVLWLWVRFPFMGSSMLDSHPGVPHVISRTFESGYTIFAVTALFALWWFLVRGRTPEPEVVVVPVPQPDADPEAKPASAA